MELKGDVELERIPGQIRNDFECQSLSPIPPRPSLSPLSPFPYRVLQKDTQLPNMCVQINPNLEPRLEFTADHTTTKLRR